MNKQEEYLREQEDRELAEEVPGRLLHPLFDDVVKKQVGEDRVR